MKSWQLVGQPPRRSRWNVAMRRGEDWRARLLLLLLFLLLLLLQHPADAGPGLVPLGKLHPTKNDRLPSSSLYCHLYIHH